MQAPETLSPVRASKRNVATVDQDLMEKVTKLNANKNLDVDPKPKGNLLANHSFTSFDNWFYSKRLLV